jgi:DNA-binding response OmpR family regulator
MSDLVLVVDDERDVAETIERSLGRAGYETLVAYRGADALALLRQRRPGIVVLDIVMPGMSGIEVLRYMRAESDLSRIPVLFLTGRGAISDKIEGFEAGADDYLTKPFDLRELELRVKALLRRSQQSESAREHDLLRVGELSLDCHSFEISTPLCTVLLTPVEFELIHFLMSHADRVYSADQLLQQVWGYPPGTGMPDLVRVHVKNIRDKIEPDPRHPMYLRNILRRGYLVPGAQTSMA